MKLPVSNKQSSHGVVSPIAEVIDDARNGRMFILIDDIKRGEEAYLCMAAQMATPDAVTFFATHARGLVSLALEKARVDQLGLPLLADSDNRVGSGPGRDPSLVRAQHAVSIEARSGVSTGISAGDRARTIAVAVNASNTASELTTPGHVFPLVARTGGVLTRAGCTEAVVDIARLAGLNASGVVCAMLRDDGAIVSVADLASFLEQHSIKVGTIADLIAYRMKHDRLVRRVAEMEFDSEYGGRWQASTYLNMSENVEHLVLQKGEIEAGSPTLVRIHKSDIFSDTLGAGGTRGDRLGRIMERIAEAGSGVLVILRDVSPTILSDSFARHRSGGTRQLRDLGIGAQILSDLGVTDIILLTSAHYEMVGIDAFGLRIVEEQTI